MRNSYGNYVVQKALNMAKGEVKSELVMAIQRNIGQLSEKKLKQKWSQLVEEAIKKGFNESPTMSPYYESPTTTTQYQGMLGNVHQQYLGGLHPIQQLLPGPSCLPQGMGESPSPQHNPRISHLQTQLSPVQVYQGYPSTPQTILNEVHNPHLTHHPNNHHIKGNGNLGGGGFQ